MQIFPPLASSALQLLGQASNADIGYVNCGNTPPLSFGGNQPYTIAAWINFASYPPDTMQYTIVSRFANVQSQTTEGEYLFTIDQNGCAVFYRGTSDPDGLVSSAQLQPQCWNHVAVTYDGTTAMLYINGVPDNTKAYGSVAPSQDTNVIIGALLNQGQGDSVFTGLIGSVRFWNVALTIDAIVDSSVQIDVEDQSAPGQVAYFDFTTIPGIDRSSNGFPLQFVGNANYSQNVPGVQLFSNGGWASCGNNDIISFPGQSPYTIEGWFVPQASSSYLISKYVSSNLSQSQYLVGIDSNARLYMQRGATTVTSLLSLETGQNYHFAAEYDGAALRLYINGNLQDGEPDSNFLPLSQLPVLLGTVSSQLITQGARHPSTVGGDAPASQGEDGAPAFIQNVRIWNVALSEDKIRQWMYNNPGVCEPGLVASFDFTGMVPTDNTNLNTLQLEGQAVLSLLSFVISPTSREGLHGSPQPLVDQVLNMSYQPAFDQMQCPLITPGTLMVPFSQEHLQSLKAGQQDAAQLRRIDQAFARAKALVAAHPELKMGVTIRRQDGIVTLIHHTLQGDFEIFSAPDTQIDPCTLWWMTFAYQLTYGFLGALGLVPTAGKIAGRIWGLIEQNAAAVLTIENLVVAGGITLDASIGVVKALYDYGLLWPIIRMGLVSAGWYALFWVLRKVIAILTGLEAAELLAGFLVWNGQLIYQASQYSSSCRSQVDRSPMRGQVEMALR